jgi:ketosteroid isomerase-like protein
MEANAEVKKEILKIIDKYAECYLNKDLNGLMNLFVSDPDFVAFGTGKEEWIKGCEQLKASFKRDFSEADDIKLFFDNIIISISGKVAWVSATLCMHALVNGVDVILPGRISMVLKQEDKKWLFTHVHFSVPAEKPEERQPWNEYY